MMKVSIKLFLLTSILVISLFAYAQSPKRITIKKIDGRPWLIDTAGQPFFAHGITHINNKSHQVDPMEIGNAMKELGFNAYGYGTPPILKNDMPYVDGFNHIVRMSSYRRLRSFKYVDVFDPNEQKRMDSEMKKFCNRNKNNPNLIGYFWTDLGVWPLKNSKNTNWVQFIKELPPDAPGQLKYQEFLKHWKGEAGQVRDEAFLRLIAREYFRILGTANRKYDPNHLIFGDRFAFPTIDPIVIEELIPYVDAIAIQPQFRPKFPKEKYDEIHKMSGGKPIIICDFAIRFEEEGKNIRGWKPEKSPEIAGQRYAEYILEALETNYIIGAFWCNPINSMADFQKSAIKQGLFDTGLKERPALNAEMKKLNERIKAYTPKSSG